MTEPTLRVEGLAKRYATYRSEVLRFATWFGLPAKPHKEFWALQDVSFTLERGHSLGIIGANGAGKSSLLKAIAGTIQPTRGRVEAHGLTAAVLELGLTFDPELTGSENVELYAHLLGMEPAQIRELEPAIRAFAEIGDAFDEPMRTYSTGMLARVAFAVATARRPDLLIVDEVLSVGDGYFQNKSFNRILEFRAAGTSIVFVSHGIEGVAAICDSAIWLDGGKVAMVGPASEVCDAYRAAIEVAKASAAAIAQV